MERKHNKMYSVTIIIITSLFTLATPATNEFVIPENTGCACLGRTLTYNCTVVGTGSTEWSGTLFSCPANGIILRHERFPSDDVVGECNQGTVLARELSFVGNCYTSQLTFVASPAFGNKSVSCIHNSDTGDIIIGTSVLRVVEGSYPPPDDITLDLVYQRMLTFSWTFNVPNCTAASYAITSDCGVCPQTTNTTSVTCSNVTVSSNEFSCEFIVRSIVCDNEGLTSNSITVNFKVPDEPIVEIVPVYSNDDQALIRVMVIVNQKDRFNSTVVNNMAGIVDTYNTYISSNMVPLAVNASCVEDECLYTVIVPLLRCHNISGDIPLTITAVNGIGESRRSNPSVIGCVNKFVAVEYDSTTSTITCQFFNQSGIYEPLKRCSVHYGLCSNQQQQWTEISRTNNMSNNVTLQLDVVNLGSTYCFTVTATRGEDTVVVEGRAEPSAALDLVSSYTIIIIAMIAVFAVILLVTALAVPALTCYCKKRNRKRKSNDIEMPERKHFSNADLKKQQHDFNETVLVKYHIESSCSVKTFCQDKGLIFRRDAVYYEFIQDVESITRDARVVFLKEGDRDQYLAAYAKSDAKLHGGEVGKPTLDGYTVFVQCCIEFGFTHLQCGSEVLYEFTHDWMWHVDDKQYRMEKISSSTSMQYGKGRIFYERKLSEDGEINTEVILIQKDGKRYLTGSQARRMANGISRNISHLMQWRVFVLSECEEHLKMSSKKDTINVLCQLEKLEDPPCIADIPLIPIRSDQLKHTTLGSNISLKDFQTQMSLRHDEPNVLLESHSSGVDKYIKDESSVLEIILVHFITESNSMRFYTGDVNALLPVREDIAKSTKASKTDKWKLFLMCKFKGDLKLAKGTLVLYRDSDNIKSRQPEGLLPVHSDHIVEAEVKENSTLANLFSQHSGLKKGKCDLFLKLDSVSDFNSVLPARDVILKDKDGRLHSGPYARRLLSEEYSSPTFGPNDKRVFEDWEAFVLSENKLDKNLSFKEKCSFCYLKHKNPDQKFVVLQVDENNVRMSDFIKKRGKSFENGNAFYEYDSHHHEEDLMYYKDVILVLSAKLTKFNVMLPRRGKKDYEVTCEFEPFYENFHKVQAPKIAHRRFIQCLSQGSRCLNQGDLVLIKKT